MIQEILDYLLIRSLLYNSDSEELIDATREPEDFVYVLNNIYLLMQEENFIFIDSHLITTVSDLIQKYRFDYNKEKEINDKMNYIIERLNDYKNMSDKRKQYIINAWVKEESESRNLPLCYRNLDNLLSLISLDASYFKGMISIDEPFVVNYIVEYVSLINLILNKFPKDFFEDLDFIEVTKYNLSELIKNKKISFIDSNMIKKTLKRIEKEYPISEDKNFQKVIKKTQN